MKSFLLIFAATFGFTAFAAGATATIDSSSSAKVSTPRSSTDSVGYYLAPVLGVSTMSLRGESNATGNDLGVSVGGLFDIGSGSLSFETGTIFNQFGGASSNDDKINLNYASIPILLKWNSMKEHDDTLYLKGGIMPSILISQEAKTKTDSKKGNDVGARAIDFGFLAGVGGNIRLSDGLSLILDVSYLRGLISVIDKENFPVMRNEGFIFSSGLSMRL